MAPRAYSYLRFSSPEQAKGDSARRQTELAASYAQRHGLELDESLTFEDLGVSAFRGRNAQEGALAGFLEAVRSGLVAPGSFLLVESLDRISRQTIGRALDILRGLVREGVTVVTLNDQTAYTAESIETELPQLVIALMTFARAHEESAMKGARVRAAWDRKKREASVRPLTKVCPAWLRLKEDRSGFEVIPGRGEVVRRIFQMAAEGVGQHTIAATLNADGVPTFGDGRRKAGVHWHRSYIAKLLGSDAPLGVYVPHSGSYVDGRLVRTPWEPVPNYYPAVVDAETVRRARLVVGPGENPKRGRHAERPTQNILAGLAKCPLCGGSMTRVSKGTAARAGRPKLVCTRAKAGAGCSYKSVPLDLVETTLRTRADELVFKPTLSEQDEELDALVAERDGLAQRIANLLDAFEEGRAGFALQTRLGDLEERHRAAEEAIRTRMAHRETTREPLVESRMADLRAALKADPFNVEAANVAFRRCAESVEVDYRSGDLLVAWRHGGVTDLLFSTPEDGTDE